MKDLIRIGCPSKGRLRKFVLNIFKKHNLKLVSKRGDRDLFGSIEGQKDIQIIYSHAREVISRLADKSLDAAFSGYDLLKESETNIQNKIKVFKKYPYGQATLVVAIPEDFIDIFSMADLEEVAFEFKEKKKEEIESEYEVSKFNSRIFLQ